MSGQLSRRNRKLLFTASGIGLVLLVTVAVIWFQFKPEAPYRPGEKITGLTSELARSLPQDAPRVQFVEVAKISGIDFQHFSGKRSSQLPEDMGSGAAWGDYDNDGRLDLFVVNQVGPLTLSEQEVKNSPARCALYHNNGDGTFVEVAAQAGVDYRGWGMGAAWGDYNNDGWIDLFLSTYGENVFYHNNGDGTFTDKTRPSGLGGRNGFWAGAAWADFNRDGFVDLYVCGYVQYSYIEPQQVSMQYDVEVPASINPSTYQPAHNLLYRNNGNGTFSEISAAAGVEDVQGRSLSAAWCDFDEDGWPDLYIANDVSDNVFYRNLGNEKFRDISHAAWVADYRGAMGLAIGDWDGDADMDIFITHWLAQENAIYSNMRTQYARLKDAKPGPLKFMDEADRYGLGQSTLDYIGWGTSFFDYDNDGKLDLFAANGSTFQERDKPWLLIPMTLQLFWNRGASEGFYEVSAASGEVFRQKYGGRGAAFGDYDNDGDVDVFVVVNGGPALLLRNDGGNQKNWLKVDLRGTKSNRQAIGAKLRLVAGESVQVRQVGAQPSYCSQNSLIEHFGLGAHTQADTLAIVWPSGTQQILTGMAVNQTVQVVEGQKP